MQKKYLLFNKPIFLFYLLIILTGCKISKVETVVSDNSSAHANKNLRELSSNTMESNYMEVPEFTPQIQFDLGEKLLKTITINLDLDNNDEQLIIFRDSLLNDSPIIIGTIDFDTTKQTHLRTWQSETLSTNTRTFEIRFVDVVGDNSLEIIAQGTNKAGEKTINIFRKATKAGENSLRFNSILSVTSIGAIEVLEEVRKKNYELGQKNGQSFPVVTYTKPVNVSNPTDIVKTIYKWQYEEDKYIPETSILIPGEKVEDQQLKDLFRNQETINFEEFISGPWYRIVEAGTLGTITDHTEIINFDYSQRKITLFDGEVQEIYSWEVSHRLLAQRLGVWMRNESINSIVKNLSVDVLALDKIRVVIKGTETGDQSNAEYLKLTHEKQQQVIEIKGLNQVKPQLSLTGIYRNDSGESIIFSSPDFTWLKNGVSRSGGFTIHLIGELSIVFKFISENGITQEITSYVLKYNEQSSETRLIRSIILRPAKLSIDGIVTQNDNKTLRFEQIEILEDPTASEVNNNKMSGITITEISE